MKQSPVLVLVAVFALVVAVGIGVLSGGDTTSSSERVMEKTPTVCADFSGRVEKMIGPERLVTFVSELRKGYTLEQVEDICREAEAQSDEELRVYIGSILSEK